MRTIACVLLVGAFVVSSCADPGGDVSEGEPADLVFLGGSVWTGVSGAPAAQAVAVRDGRVVAVGADTEVESFVGEATEIVRLDGRTLLPGFIDAHTHFISGGFQLSSVDLRDADSPEEFARRIGAFAEGLAPGTWITGGDWDHEAWGGELPRREWIDELTPEHPVLVQRLDGHMALANSLALEAAGVDAETQEPPGGSIVRDASGAPSGVLRDEAMSLVYAVIPAPDEAALDAALEAASRHALSLGVTQVHDMGSWSNLDTYRRAHARGALALRVYSVVPMATWDRMRAFVEDNGRGDDMLWWGGLKAFVDGSLGSTTAWFYDPYDDEPGTSGLLTTDTTELRAWIRGVDGAGLHAIVHAIGDRANDWLLDVFREVAADHGDRDRRFRIEHAQHLSADAIGRFAEQGVIASMQPYHAADDGRWAEKRIGPERILRTYAFRSLQDAGATLAFGSDWTVAPLDPILGIDAAVTRRTIDGANPDGWVPSERLALEETLTAYTSGAARAGYMDDRVGTIETGKLADLVVLDADAFGVDPKSLRDLRVDMTVVNGSVAYRRAAGTDGGD